MGNVFDIIILSERFQVAPLNFSQHPYLKNKYFKKNLILYMPTLYRCPIDLAIGGTAQV